VLVIALIIVVVLVAVGGIWYWRKNQSSQNPVQITSSTGQTSQPNKASSTGDTAINDWKTYQNNQLGYTVKYPSTWSLSEKNDFAYFALPSDTDPNPGKGGVSATTPIPVNISITTSSYTNLVDYRNYIDSLVSSDDGNANWTDSGLEQINGNTFFKYSWMHQAQAVDYAIADNGQVLTISFYMDDASLPFDQSISWADFQKFLSTFEVVGK
jgi:hypothetical protein